MTPQPPILIETTDEVIDRLGGLTTVANLLGTTPKAVWNWRQAGRGRFPSDTYLPLTAALKDAGLCAPLSLWGMRSPCEPRSAA